MSHDPSFEPEEAWEQEVTAALGELPSVDPPAGFLERAVDHRPLHAGRVVAMLLALSVGGLGLTFAVSDTTPGASVEATPSDSVGPGDLQTAVPPLDGSILADAADGVLALARQIGFP